MTTLAQRSRRGLPLAVSLLLTLGVSPTVFAAPPQSGGGAGEEAPPAEGDKEAAPAEGDEAPPDGEEEDDWGDEEDDDWGDEEDDDWGDEEEDDDWDGQVLIEDVSDDPEAAEEEQVEQVEVEGVKGTISGVVKDTTNGEPLMGANVRAIDTPYEVTTDADGKYVLELPPGTYTLEFFYETFSVKEVGNLVVEKDAVASQNIELTPMEGMATEQVIEAEAPKASAAVQNVVRSEAEAAEDIMSQEEMKKSGGGNVGNLARLIVGATLDDGRFLIVRGLTHRYGNTLFDGARVSSPNPELRTVPLDIFPSGALSAIVIVKTFTPDQPADFTGGSTQLESRDIPDDFTLNISANVKMNTATTGQQFLHDDRFPADWATFGNIPRGYPAGFPRGNSVSSNKDVDGVSVPRFTPEETEKLGESLFMQTPLQRVERGPGYSVSATVGDGMYLGRGTRFGWVTSAKLANDPSAKRGISGNYNCESRNGGNGGNGGGDSCSGDFTYDVRTDFGIRNGVTNNFVDNNQLSGIGLFKFDIRDNHEVYGNVFYSRDADSQVRVQRGQAFGSVGNEQVIATRHRYVMRNILFTQLGAKHEIPEAKGLKIDYFGAFSQGRRDDPGVREVLYSETPPDSGDFSVASSIRAPSYQSLFLVDNIGNGALNFEFPFKQWKRLEASVKWGGWVEGKQRDFVSRRFDYAIVPDLGGQIPIEVGDVVRDDTIGGGLAGSAGGVEPFFLRELTQPVDNYYGQQRIFAGYAMLSLPFVRWFELVGGARFEHSRIEVGPFDLFDRDADTGIDPAKLTDNDIFPSVSLVFKPTQKMNVRMVGTQTIARPEFREMAPFSFTDFVGGTSTVGNRFLKSTHIWNADLRYEFFPSGEEVVAVSAFFKWFDAPIERALSAGASTNIATFLNSDLGYNVGGEFEVKKNLGFLGRRSKKNGGGMKPKARWLEDLSIGANFAYIHSRVRLPTAVNSETGEELPPGTDPSECPADDEKCQLILQYAAASSQERPLQGQSPWIANGFLDYDNDRIGLNARLLYNAYGPRIRRIGGRGQGDEYQLQVHTLDFVFAQRIFRFQNSTDDFEASTGNELKFQLKVENMLNWNYQWGQFDSQDKFFPTLAFREGVDIEVGLSYSF